MKRIKLFALGTWIVEHFTFGLTDDALVGDLLEETERGRSAAWFWRQVCSALATGLLSRSRDFALPLVYCTAWTSLYPGWSILGKSVVAREIPAGWAALAWPWSALLPLGCGVLPAFSFVWLGSFVYVLLHPRMFRELTARRLLCGVLASLNVLLVSTPLLLWHFRQTHFDLDTLKRADFYCAFHLFSISIPLALSLLAALLFSISGTGRLARKRRQLRLKSV
jgi:hypothetical protein